MGELQRMSTSRREFLKGGAKVTAAAALLTALPPKYNEYDIEVTGVSVVPDEILFVSVEDFRAEELEELRDQIESMRQEGSAPVIVSNFLFQDVDALRGQAAKDREQALVDTQAMDTHLTNETWDFKHDLLLADAVTVQMEVDGELKTYNLRGPKHVFIPDDEMDYRIGDKTGTTNIGPWAEFDIVANRRQFKGDQAQQKESS